MRHILIFNYRLALTYILNIHIDTHIHCITSMHKLELPHTLSTNQNIRHSRLKISQRKVAQYTYCLRRTSKHPIIFWTVLYPDCASLLPNKVTSERAYYDANWPCCILCNFPMVMYGFHLATQKLLEHFFWFWGGNMQQMPAWNLKGVSTFFHFLLSRLGRIW